MNKKMEQKMIKIRNITKKWFKNEEDIFCCEKAMKEYAEFYAKKCLEKAAENAECDDVSYQNGDSYAMFAVNRNSILTIDLPEHE